MFGLCAAFLLIHSVAFLTVQQTLICSVHVARIITFDTTDTYSVWHFLGSLCSSWWSAWCSTRWWSAWCSAMWWTGSWLTWKLLTLTVGSLCWWCNKPWDGQHKDVETCPEVLTKLLVSEQLQSWTVWSWWWRWVSPLQWQELEWWSTPWSKPFILGLHHHWLTLWLLVMFWLSALTSEIDK